VTKNCLLLLSLLLFVECVVLAEIANNSTKSSPFVEAVIEKAINLMPAEGKAKLLNVRKEISLGIGSDVGTGKQATACYYFVDERKGTAPSSLAEHFRCIRKTLGESSQYSKIAPNLGRLAKCVVDICQPYHSDEAAYKNSAHEIFEKQLNTTVASLKVQFDKLDKVDNPVEFATNKAKEANKLLHKLQSQDLQSTDLTAINSEIFSLAVNSVADCWYTLLGSRQNVASGEFIGNKNSLKFHLPSCKYLPAEKNRVYFKTREEAIKEGYVPCKVCKP
jgi:hypothetical protein